jgi:hypothetical protein
LVASLVCEKSVSGGRLTCGLWLTTGVTIYGYIFTAFAVASIGGSLMAKQLVLTVGYDHVFKIFSLSSFGALILAALLQY